MKKILSVFILCVLLLTACAKSSFGAGPTVIEENAGGRVSDDMLTKGYFNLAMKELREGLNSDNNTNVLLSPLSAYYALTMITMGCDGNSSAQLTEFFCEDSNKADINRYALKLSGQEDDKLKLANSLWINSAAQEYIFNNQYKSFLEKYYGADCECFDFNEGTEKKINRWVEKKTLGRIKELVGKMDESESRNPKLLLINALTFDGQWKNEYSPKSINENGKFKNYRGDLQQAKMLASTETVYLSNDDATGFLKYYDGERYAFMAVLPNDSELPLAEFVNSLEDSWLNSFYQSAEKSKVEVQMPCFSAEYKIALEEMLQREGVTDVFSGKADFKYILNPESYDKIKKSELLPLFVSGVIQKTFVEVNERGTKAAAATVVEIKDTALPLEEEKPRLLALNRPFVYAIVDVENGGIPLFIGTVDEL